MMDVISSFIILKSSLGSLGMLGDMDRELIENILLILLSSSLVGVMVGGGYLLVVGIPAFARFLFTVWYVLTV